MGAASRRRIVPFAGRSGAPRPAGRGRTNPRLREEAVRHPIQTLVLVAVVGACAGEVRGEDAPSVDELVALALERAPSLAALRARAEAAKEEVGPAGVMPDPTIEFLYQDINFPEYTVGEEDMSMIGVELRQPLPFFGKRGARREAARAQATLRENERAESERNVAF